MSRPKGYTFPASYAIECPVPDCGKTIKNKSGLRAHALSEHGLRISNVDEWIASQGGESEPQPDQSSENILPSASNRQLREQVERRRLEGELARYGVKPEPKSTIEQLREMMNLARELQTDMGGSQPKEPKWYEKMLSNMSMTEVLALAKNALGIQNNQSDGIALLQSLGFNLSDLIKSSMGSQVLPEALTLPNGSQIPKGTPIAVLQYYAASEKSDQMAQVAANWLEKLAPILGEKAAQMAEDRVKRNGGGGVGDPKTRQQPLEPIFITCTTEGCGTRFEMSPNLREGDVFNCPKCETEYEFCPPETEKRKPRIQKAAQAEDSGLPDIIECECGQTISVPEGTVPGTWLSCQVCGRETPVMSDKPIPPGPQLEPAVETGERRE